VTAHPDHYILRFHKILIKGTSMRVTVERAALLKALGHVQSVVERRNTIPILSNVLLDAQDGVLTLTATDLDLAIVEGAAAQTSIAGATTVAAHTLFDIARKLPEGAQVELATGDGRLALAAGRSRFQLQTLPREDFPAIADGELPFGFTLPATTLKQMIDKTKFAISTEETRYYLNGIFFHVTEEAKPALRAVATDGHRLARVAIDRPEGAVGMPDVIIPRKAVTELRKLLDEADGDVRVQLSATRIRFSLANAVLSSRLIDGTFPDYSRVIPTGNDKIMKIDTGALSEGVDRVSTIATDKTRAVKLSLTDDRLTLAVTSPENGTASEELAASYSSTPIDIGFNSRYLLDILGQIETGEVEIHLADGASPTLIREGKDSNAIYVLMPMRV
jgi:DNA polymerase III subunit beta